MQKIEFGNRRLVGQKNAREQIERILNSNRASHSYLFTGPGGVGKTAFTLAFAEYLNGVNNLTELGSHARSRKKNWLNHPDIHVFIPLPTTVTSNKNKISREMSERLSLLAEDPYEVVDFKLRPVLSEESSSKNRQAFYPIDYFHSEIRPTFSLKPNEGDFTIVIITGIETMKKEAANAFLKLLEEPPEQVIFLLTASGTDQLLPTIVSRCQHIKLAPLSSDVISDALQRYDGMSKSDADYLARISDGNYALTRFYDLKLLQELRTDIIRFLRISYVQDADEVLTLVQDWHSKLNTENQIALCNSLEMILRDIMIYKETNDRKLVTNIDQLEVIEKFCESLTEARIPEMIEQLNSLKSLLYQNIQFKLAFTVLSFRFSLLMRGHDPAITDNENWKHLPALTELS